MIGNVVLSRVRRASLLAGLVFAAVPAGSALADTVGQTGVPIDNTWAGGLEIVQTSAPIPAAGVVTSFRTRSASSSYCYAIGEYDFQVLRPLGGDQYRVLGDTGNKTDPCDGALHVYHVTISVQPGDVLGVSTPGENPWSRLLSQTSGVIAWGLAQPQVGDTITVPNSDTGTVDESATLVTQNDQGQNNNAQ